MRLLHSVAVGLLLVGIFGGAQAEDGLDTERLDREAKTLFVTVLKDTGVPTRPCELDSAWSDQAIPYEIAHRVLGLQAFAGLRSPSGVAPPSDVIGAVLKEVMCSEEEWGRYQADHVVAQVAALRALPKTADLEPLWFTREWFTFPIFDQAYGRAVIVHERLRWPAYVVDAKGTVMRAAPEGGGSAYVYERKAGAWQRVEESDLFTVG